METDELPGQGLKIKHISKGEDSQGKKLPVAQINGSCYVFRNFQNQAVNQPFKSASKNSELLF